MSSVLASWWSKTAMAQRKACSDSEAASCEGRFGSCGHGQLINSLYFFGGNQWRFVVDTVDQLIKFHVSKLVCTFFVETNVGMVN